MINRASASRQPAAYQFMSESSEDDHALREDQEDEIELNPDDPQMNSFRSMSRIM